MNNKFDWRKMIDSKIPLPTDNLYKFMALFGLVLFVLSYVPTYRQNKITMDAIDAIIEIQKK